VLEAGDCQQIVTGVAANSYELVAVCIRGMAVPSQPPSTSAAEGRPGVIVPDAWLRKQLRKLLLRPTAHVGIFRQLRLY
jgi:hypothetical protein